MLRVALAVLLSASPALACPRVTDLPLPRPAQVQSEAAVREAPRTDAGITATLKRGEQVTVTAECENWREVRVGDSSGWVHRALLR